MKTKRIRKVLTLLESIPEDCYVNINCFRGGEDIPFRTDEEIIGIAMLRSEEFREFLEEYKRLKRIENG